MTTFSEISPPSSIRFRVDIFVKTVYTCCNLFNSLQMNMLEELNEKTHHVIYIFVTTCQLF